MKNQILNKMLAICRFLFSEKSRSKTEKIRISFFSKTLIIYALFISVFPANHLKADTGDTIVVQTLTFNHYDTVNFSSPKDTFLFPPDTTRYEKILMYYTLKCNYNRHPNDPEDYPCGEWDYGSPTLLWDKTGEKFEIGRYITPYGINLNLGSGFTWIYDVSDFEPILHDSIILQAGSGVKELIDIKFLMIEGIPPRDVIKTENFWAGSFPYGGMVLDTVVTPLTVTLDSVAETFSLRTSSSGHGFGSGENCAEFCPKTHYITVDGTERFSWYLWTECSTNPLFPQGGTWIFDRGGWCPGAEVKSYNHELTPFVTAGTQAIIDYGVEGFASPGTGEGSYWLETQLISYTAPNFILDASIEKIVAPNKWEYQMRKNPICDEPIIIIKNTGATQLTSLDITYGVDGGTDHYYTWTGSLDFLETSVVNLPLFNWNGLNPLNPVFHVTISLPNSGIDEYSNNNILRSNFELPPVSDSVFVLWLKTNNRAIDNSYSLEDNAGNVLYSRTSLTNNTLYKDTFTLNTGCYTFKFMDSTDDGIDFWYNCQYADPSDCGGWLMFRRIDNSILTTFKEDINGNGKAADFGRQIYHQFTVGYELGSGTGTIETNKNELLDNFFIYPNPSTGKVNIAFQFNEKQDITLDIFNRLGQNIYTKNFKKVSSEDFEVDLSKFLRGIYLVRVHNNKTMLSKKIVLLR